MQDNNARHAVVGPLTYEADHFELLFILRVRVQQGRF